MADEDVIFINTESISFIIREMEDNDYGIAGIREGGLFLGEIKIHI